MEFGIFLNSVLPVRSEPEESSEMVTQLLFGEFCHVLDEKNGFVRIENYFDNYRGWVDKKMLFEINKDIYDKLKAAPVFRTIVPVADVFCLSEKSIYHLSAGSLLPFYDHEKSSFTIVDKKFQIHPTFVSYLPGSSKENILQTVMLFLNTPYLWGGKNIFGIDCSGFVQVVYSLHGFTLPRDASMQAKEGSEIGSIAKAEPSDLFFFEKNERITHVGIYMGDGKIIHSSGKVRVDKVDEKGIFNEETNGYTHSLAAIRRI